jgi:GTP-binding protein
MFNYLKYYKLPVTIIATKSDKVKQSLKAKTDKMLNSAFELNETDNIIYFSSVEKTGREEVYATIEQNL